MQQLAGFGGDGAEHFVRWRGAGDQHRYPAERRLFSGDPVVVGRPGMAATLRSVCAPRFWLVRSHFGDAKVAAA